MTHISKIVRTMMLDARKVTTLIMAGPYAQLGSPFGPTQAGLAAWVQMQLYPIPPSTRGKEN